MSNKNFEFSAGWPAPIEYCEPLSSLCGRDVYLKREDFADDIGSGNKVRKLEKLFPRLEAAGVKHIILDGTTQSNSCMSVAFYAPLYDITPHLILYGSTEPRGNYAKILASQANVHLLPEWDPARIEEERRMIVDHLSANGAQHYVAPTGLSSAETVDAGRDIATEITDQEKFLDVEFDDIYVAAGTGSTVAGVAFQDALLGHSSRVTGIVIANDAAFFKKVGTHLYDSMSDGNHTDTPHLPAFYEGALGEGYGAAAREHLPLQKDLQDKGYFFDSVYMLKVCIGAIQLSRENELGSPALIIHTGGNNQQELLP